MRRSGAYMSNASRHRAERFRALAVVLFLAHSLRAVADDGLDYTYVDLDYSIDSTIQTYGDSYDSDNSFRFTASYLLNRHLFLSAQYYSAGYDLELNDDFGLSGFSFGLGYRARIGGENALPIDWFAILSYEHNSTQTQVDHVDNGTGPDGGGLKAGIRAAVTENLELSFDAYQQSFGSEFMRLNGDLNGLSFELGGALRLSDRFRLTAAYRTGELDYRFLDNYPTRYEIEVDRDEVFVGVRWSFE